MKATIARDVLMPALARVSALLPSRSTYPIVECAKLAIGPGGIVVTTTNLEAWASETIDTEVREAWEGCVDADRLRAFVRSLPAGTTVTVTVNDHALTIVGADAQAQLLVLPANDFPIYFARGSDTPAIFKVEAGALAATLDFVAPTASEEHLTRPCLFGAYLDPEGFAVTTDTHRMAVHRFATSLPAFAGVILPLPIVKLLPTLLKGLTEAVTVSITRRLISFTAGRWHLTSQLVDGTFPTWRQGLPTCPKNAAVVIEMKALRAAVGRVVAVCVDRRTKISAARLRLNGSELLLTAATDVGDCQVETTIAVASGPDEINVTMSARYLAEALDVIEADQVELYPPAGRQPAVWLNAVGESENGILIMPTRW